MLTKDLRDEWARRLKAYRLAAGLTQDQLADKANVSQAVISQIENRARAPRDDIKIAVAVALDVPVTDLFPYTLEVAS